MHFLNFVTDQVLMKSNQVLVKQDTIFYMRVDTAARVTKPLFHL